MAEDLRVKICGVMRREDALAVDRSGADYLGVVLSRGFSRSVQLAAAPALVEGVTVARVAVLVNEDPDGAGSAARALGADVIQLHGEEAPSVLTELRARGPWKLWKAVRARSAEDIERAIERYGELADGILVEGWKDGVLGGGGALLTVDPGRVRGSIPQDLDFVLAGGLHPDSVAEAVTDFGPDIVDVSSGVEQALGEKDHDLVARFVDAARGARRSASTATGTSTEGASR